MRLSDDGFFHSSRVWPLTRWTPKAPLDFRALINEPALILADEPTGNLDPDTAHKVLMLLRDEIKANGASAILVTHSLAAAATADRILTLSKHGLQPRRP